MTHNVSGATTQIDSSAGLHTKLHSKADRGGDEESTQAYVLVRRGV